jgi:hypothetical protein
MHLKDTLTRSTFKLKFTATFHENTKSVLYITVSFQQQASDIPDDRLLRISDMIIYEFINKILSSTCMCESSLYRTTHPILGFICIIRNP